MAKLPRKPTTLGPGSTLKSSPSGVRPLPQVTPGKLPAGGSMVGGRKPTPRGAVAPKMPTVRPGGPAKGKMVSGGFRDITIPGGRMPARPKGYFGGGAAGAAKRNAYQAARQTKRSLRGASAAVGRNAAAMSGRQPLAKAMNQRASVMGARGAGRGAASRQAAGAAMKRRAAPKRRAR